MSAFESHSSVLWVGICGVGERIAPIFHASMNALVQTAGIGCMLFAVLLSSRLRPDMLPFVRQTQIVCDGAKNMTARLAGVEAPRYEDNEASFEDIKARIKKTLDFIGAVNARDVEAGESREIVFPLGPNKMKMKGPDYIFHFALPNFYFHLTTAYGILRHNGVEIGKRDFLGAVVGISPA